MSLAALVRLGVILLASALALGLMARIPDRTTGQIVAVAVVTLGLIAGRLLQGWMDRR